MGKVLTKRPCTAGNDEIHSNPRSRSARLRVFEFEGQTDD
ncbi:MAG TPA: 16S rRNA (cytosine(1402)-N(4))-methyltransferase [SAR324 cluster bacterium]|nr:16S rRNA (cytosine(1402)-N(4))-methyltransferase [SAR324 cluster bacterium]